MSEKKVYWTALDNNFNPKKQITKLATHNENDDLAVIIHEILEAGWDEAYISKWESKDRGISFREHKRKSNFHHFIKGRGLL